MSTKDVFPVIVSTLAVGAIAAFVKEKYGLDGTVTASILKTGISHTYLIRTDPQHYVFRVYTLHWRTEKEIAAEITLLNLLKESHLPVSYPIPDARSVFIQQLPAPEGMRYAVLFSFAKGDKQLTFDAALHEQVGCIMAKLHQVTQDVALDRVSYTPDTLLLHPFSTLAQFLPADTEEMAFMKTARDKLQLLYSGADTAQLRKGIVHLDIWFDNIVIDPLAGITLFDFDFCGNGWLFLDIAYYILQLYSTEATEADFKQKKASFLKGYESVTVITTEELRLIPAGGTSLYIFYLGIQCSRYDNWSNVFVNDVYLKRFINLRVKRWWDFNGMADG